MWLPIRGTSDMTEATHFSQCVHDQQRRLEAEDCDSIRCAQLISGGRRRIRPPCTVPRSRSPHNVLHSPSYYCIHSSVVVIHVSCMCVLISLTVAVQKAPLVNSSTHKSFSPHTSLDYHQIHEVPSVPPQ